MSFNNQQKHSNMAGAQMEKPPAKDRLKDHWNNKVKRVDDVDKKVLQMALDVPHVHKFVAVVCVLMNVLLPGFGTITAACATKADTVSKT